jgi:hypothetical protein
VDPQFKEVLLCQRGAAAEAIGLTLEPGEVAMLAAAPASQLEAIIARTSVPQEHRRAFLGQAAAAMAATLGLVSVTTSCSKGIEPDMPERTKGIRPDRPPQEGPTKTPEPSRGTRPDRPPAGTEGGTRPN